MMNATNPTPPPEDAEAWEKPSVYSVIVIALVFGLIGYGLYIGKLTWTESLGASVLGLITWVTRGARPPIANKIGPKPPTPSDSTIPMVITPITEGTRQEMPTPREPPSSVRRAGFVAVVLALGLLACPSPYIRPAAYGAELDVCVETAKTKAESQKCREDVARKYGRDAGAGDQ